MITSSPTRRPGWIWLIAIWYFISFTLSAIGIYAVYEGLVPLSEDHLAYYKSVGPLQHVISIVIAVTNGAGAIYLFRLRKEALVFFSNALVLGFGWSLWAIFHNGLLRVMPLTSLVLSWALGLLVCRYVSRLIDSGVLRGKADRTDVPTAP